MIGINGAAAHLISPGNLVIIMSFLQLDETELATHQVKVVHVDSDNRMVAMGSDPTQPVPGAVEQMAGA